MSFLHNLPLISLISSVSGAHSWSYALLASSSSLLVFNGVCLLWRPFKPLKNWKKKQSSIQFTSFLFSELLIAHFHSLHQSHHLLATTQTEIKKTNKPRNKEIKKKKKEQSFWKIIYKETIFLQAIKNPSSVLFLYSFLYNGSSDLKVFLAFYFSGSFLPSCYPNIG